ncbi:MAG: hypothetical protein Q4C20_14710 [Erysipelotrichaceae bacterium]|nr:hypothetical protein [Erysipelotrichaceae bacterium]
MKNAFHIAFTLLIMLMVSRFIIRIIDATVQIDDDIGLLVILIVIIDSLIGFISFKIHKAKHN